MTIEPGPFDAGFEPRACPNRTPQEFAVEKLDLT